jgi:hypothetical protein
MTKYHPFYNARYMHDIVKTIFQTIDHSIP